MSRSTPVAGTEIDLLTAQSNLDVPLLLPDAPFANAKNLTGIFALGAHSIELRYPMPDETSADLDQPYISVFETAWTQGDPTEFDQADINANPDVGKALCQVGKLPGLCVSPRSPSSVGQSNPAYVRVVVGKTEVDLAGGDSVATLIQSANSLTPSSSSASG